MAQPPGWVFAQLGGPKKTKVLNGWQAPFGRRRHAPLLNAGITVREQTTYLPGDVEPIVHEFGNQLKDWELHGRFMDSALAEENGALRLKREWHDFVADKQVVRATWGQFLSYRIFIKDLDLEIEAATDIAWKMSCVVYADEAAVVTPANLTTVTPLDLASQMRDQLATATAPYTSGSLTDVLKVLPEVADLIDTLIGQLNAPAALVFDVASSLSDFESALTADLGKLKAGVSAIETSIIDLRDATTVLVESARQFDIQDPVGVLSGPDAITLTATKIDTDIATENLLALLADMRNEIDKAARSAPQTAVQAQTGDTWERLAKRKLGGIGSARQIRGMNGGRYGEQPVAGRKYTIPRV